MRKFTRDYNRKAGGILILLFTLLIHGAMIPQLKADEVVEKNVDQIIDETLKPIADTAEAIVFWAVPVTSDSKVPLVLIILAVTAIFLTIYFRFINFRAMGVAKRTIQGKYTDPDAPGQISHFQALSAALSATVGLGNIAGVAVAIGIGGAGATFWMIVVGLCGMTTKFTECTLGVKFRRVDPDGTTRGGAMYYLRDGLGAKGGMWVPLGKILAISFAIFCIAGAIGAGNMFQSNQAQAQFSDSFGVLKTGWHFGLIVAVMVALVIIGGIVWIARVTSFLVPFMCVTYVIAAIVVLVVNASAIPGAIGLIFSEAFSGSAAVGGFIGALIQGIKRGVFSNEAGVGSAPIAHSAVKTSRPASEGLVALLEPFIDTVVVCTMTALVIISTGMWNVKADALNELQILDAPAGTESVATVEAGTKFLFPKIEGDDKQSPEGWYHVKEYKGEATGWVAADQIRLRDGWGGGIWLTSESFKTVIGWFPYVLAIAVFLFAFSTMISWSYYAEQAVIYLFGNNRPVVLAFKLIFCGFIVVGAAASLGNVIRLADALFFCMVVPNLVGVYVLLPVVKKELSSYLSHVRKVDEGSGE
ncbi:MAG: alanine:cation symporter family protein [Verrucomicrobiales bacterium]|nr:alanine:cation symporter family protein [Verrucomicrobiales bacterium]